MAKGKRTKFSRPFTTSEEQDTIVVAGGMTSAGSLAENDCNRLASLGPAVQYDTNVNREGTEDSTLSSAVSETFDRVPDNSDSYLTKVDVNGILRYSSMDNGEDTGLSSVSTSSHSEAKISHNRIKSTPSSLFSHDGEARAPKRRALSPESPQYTDHDHDNSHPRLPSPPSHPSHADLQSFDGQPLASSGYAARDFSAKAQKMARMNKLKANVHPSSSIPKNLSWDEYGRQCVLAAHSSRLNPYALHTAEYRLLRDRISQSQITSYLNIRNSILRLWTRNPMVSVTAEEAAGCAKESRFFELAYFAYKWLVRNGYINFGCVEVPRPAANPPRGRRSNKQKTIVVIGAGMSGLGCARQLEGLFAQLGDNWINRGEHPPQVIVLEGRKRIGGRVYSHPLRSQVEGSLPGSLRNTAEMGAQIITGFDHGNPLNAIVRGQLGLRYHLMWDEIIMHDSDGKAVNHERDMLVNKIHNDLLERTSDFRIKSTPSDTLEGIPDLIDTCQDPIEDDFDEQKPFSAGATTTFSTGQDRQQAIPPGFAKLQGRTQVVAGNSTSRTAAQAVKSAGWDLRPGISRNHSLNLDSVSRASGNPTLGATMDEAVRQYQNLVELTPQDMRLLNWHYADLEYANAAMVSSLSLSGHDQDSGNEFEGKHSEVVGGYIQVPRGLMMLPTQLDVRFNSVVKSIKYSPDSTSGNGQATVVCANGEVIDADEVVLTSPLGVLKAQTIAFEPPLPDWKRGAIDRLGFGLLNKVVLVFERPFWDEKFDMFGLLNEAEKKNSMDPDDYANRRGRFYLLWNCITNSGRPMLIALMAGKAAHEAEVTDTHTLVREVTGRLAKTFAPQPVPAPVEAIVTRWKKDPFTRGTYSFVAPDTKPGDYDVMAAPVGNLHFAGEATCGTHPATVHGAYLSGLRAAAEVVETLLGPVEIPQPLVAAKSHEVFGPPLVHAVDPSPQEPRPKILLKYSKATIKTSPREEPKPYQPATPTAHVNPYRSINSRALNEEYEALILSAIFSEIAERPLKPGRPGVNPFLMFTNDHWNECKLACSAARGSGEAKASRNEVRTELGRQWRNLSDEIKKPYLERCEAAQRLANEARTQYEKDVVQWDEDARRIRMKFIEDNPAVAADVL